MTDREAKMRGEEKEVAPPSAPHHGCRERAPAASHEPFLVCRECTHLIACIARRRCRSPVAEPHLEIPQGMAGALAGQKAVNQPLRLLDLFSGIGAFSIGLEASGAFETVAYCEIEDYCRRVLASRHPGVPIYDDVRALTADRLRSDGIHPNAICGGFPCQDISDAGSGLGLAGERSGLWREYARLIGELGPRYVIVENVAALQRRGLATVLGDLADLGYDAEWDTVSACAVGAPHVRRRLFIVAYPNGLHGWQGLWNTSPRPDWQIQAINGFARARAGWAARLANPSELYGGADGLPFGRERNRAIGNSIVPQIPELIGRAILEAQAAGVAAEEPVRGVSAEPPHLEIPQGMPMLGPVWDSGETE